MKRKTALILTVLLLIAAWIGLSLPDVWKWFSPTQTGVAPHKRSVSPVTSQIHSSESFQPSPTSVPLKIQPPDGPNAADFYKKAFELFQTLTDEEKKMIQQPQIEVDAAKTDALFEKIKPIMELLRQAAQANFCEWEQKALRFDTPMPQLQWGTKLGQVALWDAGYRFQTGDPQGAIEDLAARNKLGGNLAQTLIGVLVGNNMQKSGYGLVAQNMGTIDNASSAALDLFLTNSTPCSSLNQAMEFESSAAESLVKSMLDPKERERAREIAHSVQDTKDENMWNDVITNPQKYLAEVDWLKKVYQEYAAYANASDAEFTVWWANVQTETEQHPLSKIAFPSLKNIHDSLRATKVDNSMMQAANAILKGEPQALAIYRDPVTGQSFTYEATENGFVLRSTTTYRGKPITKSFTLH